MDEIIELYDAIMDAKYLSTRLADKEQAEYQCIRLQVSIERIKIILDQLKDSKDEYIQALLLLPL